MFTIHGRRLKNYLYQRNIFFQDSQPVQNDLVAQRRVEISFAILAKRLTSFLTGNTCIDTSVQKEGVSLFSSCIEYTSAITQLIREAKEGRKDLTVVWLDLVSAYGSIPH